MRGEYVSSASNRAFLPELPPRARRIRNVHQPGAFATGTTSACAENTILGRMSYEHEWNYLRVRGEYACPQCNAVKKWELPPRARRIQRFWGWGGGLVGTTSACAENTNRIRCYQKRRRNYLRVRGEYLCFRTRILGRVELPPRARRILNSLLLRFFAYGTTSACAENTYYVCRVLSSVWNYLRVRGEYLHRIALGKTHQELPPRARRILRCRSKPLARSGTTSACAENTA